MTTMHRRQAIRALACAHRSDAWAAADRSRRWRNRLLLALFAVAFLAYYYTR